MKPLIRIGTRGSQLALYQAELVKGKILENFPLIEAELVIIKTSGDMVRKMSPHPFDTKRMFTREIEEALLKGEIDLAAHSAKDLAAELPEGLELGAVLEREDPRDCLVSKDHLKVSELPLGARIGTSSLRRKMQLLRFYPELIVEDIRGNVDTRIKKIDEGFYDAVVLAHAGIKRLGLGHYVAEIFDAERFYPAPGQGVIAVQSRSKDGEMKEILHVLNHPETFKILKCERAFLKTLEGGCQLPCGISTILDNDHIQLRGGLFAIEEHAWVEAFYETSSENPEQAGQSLAQKILETGGQGILEQIRHSSEKSKNSTQ